MFAKCAAVALVVFPAVLRAQTPAGDRHVRESGVHYLIARAHDVYNHTATAAVRVVVAEPTRKRLVSPPLTPTSNGISGGVAAVCAMIGCPSILQRAYRATRNRYETWRWRRGFTKRAAIALTLLLLIAVIRKKRVPRLEIAHP